MSQYQLAQLNIGRMLAPLDDPVMMGFVARLEEINVLAERSPGFVWRLQSEEGDATSIRPFGDDRILVNMSVWESIETLKEYTFRTAHSELLKQRRQWFEKFERAYMVLWWIESGHIPTIEEAKLRLEHLQQHGASPHAFTFQKPFPPPQKMNDTLNLHLPPILQPLIAATRAMGFAMASDELTGSLLRTLAATKPAGNLLELGTGTGLATAWLLDGMDAQAALHTVDQDESLVAVAKQHLAQDSRVTFATMKGEAFIESLLAQQQRFDLIFADTWPGKFWLLEETLSLLKVGGLYVIDDLLPQPNWPEDHPPKVAHLIATLEQRTDLRVTKLNWSTGLILATKIH